MRRSLEKRADKLMVAGSDGSSKYTYRCSKPMARWYAHQDSASAWKSFTVVTTAALDPLAAVYRGADDFDADTFGSVRRGWRKLCRAQERLALPIMKRKKTQSFTNRALLYA